MRNLISGIVGLAWGGMILLCGFLSGGPQGEGAYYAGSVCGLVTGALFFFAGAFYLVLGLREILPEAPRRKRRRRRDDDRPRRRRRPRWDEDD
jgi:zinc transporter ZupT